MLTGPRASEHQSGVDDLREGPLCASTGPVIAGRDDEERMRVAVARIRDVGDEHTPCWVPLTAVDVARILATGRDPDAMMSSTFPVLHDELVTNLASK
ncbi:MAG: hypothetical protein WAK00_00865, partial [Microbacterium sp.]